MHVPDVWGLWNPNTTVELFLPPRMLESFHQSTRQDVRPQNLKPNLWMDGLRKIAASFTNLLFYSINVVVLIYFEFSCSVFTRLVNVYYATPKVGRYSVIMMNSELVQRCVELESSFLDCNGKFGKCTSFS